MPQPNQPADGQRPLPPTLEKQQEDVQRQLDESTRGAREMTDRFRRQAEARKQERAQREANNAPWWVPVGLLAGLGGVAALLIWLDRRKVIAREQMQRHLAQAQSILALILDEADDDRIWAAIRALRLSPQDKSPFLAAFSIASSRRPSPGTAPMCPAGGSGSSSI